jgi:hypothetical protein
MENSALCEQSFEIFMSAVSLLQALNNALRTGVDEGQWIEKDPVFYQNPDTIKYYSIN